MQQKRMCGSPAHNAWLGRNVFLSSDFQDKWQVKPATVQI